MFLGGLSRGSRRTRSLKVRLGLGAALLAAGTLLTAGILYYAMSQVAERLDAALDSEARMTRYAALSRQAASFLVVATEAVQTGQGAVVRLERVAPIDARMRQTLDDLRAGVERAVENASGLGLDEQSRYGTQSLGLARMEAVLDSALVGFGTETDDTARLRAHIDEFATGFDQLLNQAVSTEIVFRNGIVAGIDALRRNLTRAALAIAALTIGLVAGFYFGLIRPQFRRLDRLRAAARMIGREEFGIALPDTAHDEIGGLYAETNRMAASLQSRQDQVRAEWDRLNEVIAARTEDLRAANAQLETVDENRRRLFADLSHELRTPLTVIQMEAQLGLKGAPESGAAFRTIEARATRLNRRIDDLLRVARSDSGQLALEIVTVPLARIAAEATAEMRAELDAAGIEFSQTTVPDVHVDGDPNWLRQTVVSLLRNTIRHAREGARARLEAVDEGEMAGLAVVDNGPGISAANADLVFERFTQAGTGNSQGFGVGLALARWVIEAQGGEIALVSPVSRDEALGAAPGTKIAVLLPRADD